MDYAIKRWTEKELKKLKDMASSGNYTYPEIAKVLKRNSGSIANKARYLGISNAAYMRRKTKHAHLRKPVMEYFLNHSAKESQKRFKLTASEFKSLMTVGYKRPEFNHLRKDTRRNDQWSFDETIFLLRHAGIQEREWIAKKLKRGTMHSVKEMLSRINSNSRYMHGLPHKSAEELLGYPVEGIKTKAGPISEKNSFRYIIVPWVVLYSKSKRIKDIPDHIRTCLKALARFQMWILGTKTIKATVNHIEKTARKK